jgi:pilus assembly protein CpaC
MKRLSLLLIALVASMAAMGWSVPAHAASGSAVVAAASTSIELDVGKGRLVRLAKPANSVFVADPKIADVEVKSPTLIYVFGRASGATTLYAVSEHDEVLLNAEIRVHYDIAAVRQAIHNLVPRSDVTVTAVDDSIVLGGTVYSAADGDSIQRIAKRFVPDQKQLINDLKVDAPNQVNLRVRVAEVSRNVVKELGINWNNLFKTGGFSFGLLTTLPGVTNATPSIGTFGYKSGPNGTADVNALIDALEQHGLITMLAEPNLTAVSGEPANFLAGGEFPVPVPQSSTTGATTITIEWKQFGVSLNFVATILSGNRISLHVAPEVSELTSTGAVSINGFVVPALTTRRAETTVDLASGQSFAIAGLLQNNITQNINKFPWLGDVPVLGTLFRSENFQRGETELVIIVTPYLVHPIATASQAVAPTDGYVPSTDRQLVLNGSEYQPQALRQAHPPLGPAGTRLIGPVGFDLE